MLELVTLDEIDNALEAIDVILNESAESLMNRSNDDGPALAPCCHSPKGPRKY